MRSGLAFVVVATGCDGVFGLGHIAPRTFDAAPDSGPPPPACLRESFDTPEVDRLAWSIYDELNLPVVLAQQAGTLSITLVPNMPGTSNGITSRGKYDVTGGSLELAMLEVPAGANSEAGFDLAIDGANYFLIAYGNGFLTLQTVANGVKSNQVVQYNATMHRYLRIAHDQGADAIVFETSAARTTWTRHRSVPRMLDVSAMFVDVYAGMYGTGDPTGGRARFDDVRLVTATCP